MSSDTQQMVKTITPIALNVLLTAAEALAVSEAVGTAPRSSPGAGAEVLTDPTSTLTSIISDTNEALLANWLTLFGYTWQGMQSSPPNSGKVAGSNQGFLMYDPAYNTAASILTWIQTELEDVMGPTYVADVSNNLASLFSQSIAQKSSSWVQTNKTYNMPPPPAQAVMMMDCLFVVGCGVDGNNNTVGLVNWMYVAYSAPA